MSIKSIYNPNNYTEGAPPLASAIWDDVLASIAKESTEGSESEIASILADQARTQLDLLYSSGLPENEKAAVLADYLQRSGFSADIVPQLSGGEFTKEDVVSTCKIWLRLQRPAVTKHRRKRGNFRRGLSIC